MVSHKQLSIMIVKKECVQFHELTQGVLVENQCTEDSTVYTVVMDCCMEMISKTFTDLDKAKLFVAKLIDSYNTYNLPVDGMDGLDYEIQVFVSKLFWLILKNEFSDEKYKQLQEEMLSKYIDKQPVV